MNKQLWYFIRFWLAVIPAMVLFTSCETPTNDSPGSETGNTDEDEAFARIDSSTPETVYANCGDVLFAVALNNDDDNQDGIEDRDQKLDPEIENNFLEMVFQNEEAAKVRITPPILEGLDITALGTRIEVYGTDRKSPLDFEKAHTLPFSIYIEGVDETQVDETIVLDYEYLTKDNNILCGGVAKGKVPNPSMHLSGIDPSNPKLLALGRINVQIKNSRGATAYAWTYDGTGAFQNAARRSTRFTADTTFTPVASRGAHQMRCTVTFPTGPVLLNSALNITAPRTVTTPTTGALPAQSSGTISSRRIGNVATARRTSYFLLSYNVTYTIQDQFNDPITESTRGGANITIREDVPIQSDIRAGVDDLQVFFDRSVRTNTTRNWKNKNNGRIADVLRLSPLIATIMELNQGRLEFIPTTVGSDVCHMRTHDWFVSVNSNAALNKQVTRNTLETTVASYRRLANTEEVSFTTTYTVVLVP